MKVGKHLWPSGLRACLVFVAAFVVACGAATVAAPRSSATTPTSATEVIPPTAVVQPLTPTPAPTASRTAEPSAPPTARPTPPPTPRPTARPTPRPTSPPNTCGAPANPWGYNFCGGGVITNPPSSFCAYFNCIASFWQSTKGYVDECNDGTYSHSGGRSGACSSHGGERRPLYS
jgi:hypothetical protein